MDHVYLSDHAGISGVNVTPITQITHVGALLVNGSYVGTTSFTLPNNISGTYYIVVVTDPELAVYEGSNDPSSKTAYNSVNVTARALPALTVGTISAPATAMAGTTVSVKWTVTNNGAGGTLASEASWIDSVYRSSSSVFDSSAVLAATYYKNGGLAAGASYNTSASFSIPLGVTGTQYIYVITDSGQAVYEGSTRPAGGIGSTSLTTTAAPYAVLSVGSISAPATGYTGQPLTIGWTVTNSHTASTTNVASWTDTVYLSSDQFIDETSIAVGTVTHNGALAAGASYQGTLTTTLPAYLSGPYYIFVVADSQHQVYQAGNTSGNTAQGANTVNVVVPALATLSNTVLSIPSLGTTGQPANPAITWKVTNTSTTAAVGTWVDSIYLSGNGTFNSSDVLIGQVTHTGGLAAGASYTASSNATLPAEIVPGMYYVIVRADSQGVVRETDRSGNQAVSTTRISMDVQALTLARPPLARSRRVTVFTIESPWRREAH